MSDYLKEVWVWDNTPNGKVVARQTRMKDLIPGMLFCLRDHEGHTIYAEAAGHPVLRDDGEWEILAHGISAETGEYS